MLICTELSKMWLKFLDIWSNIFYLYVIQLFANLFLLNIYRTCEGYTKCENLDSCYRPIACQTTLLDSIRGAYLKPSRVSMIKFFTENS